MYESKKMHITGQKLMSTFNGTGAFHKIDSRIAYR